LLPLLCRFLCIITYGRVSLLLEPINKILEGLDSLSLLYSHFAFLRLGMCHEYILVLIKRGRDDDDLHKSVIIMF
jgi:hypothetical protein